MSIAVAIILLLLWALGLATSFTIGGYIHLLPALAAIVVLIRIVGRKKAVSG